MSKKKKTILSSKRPVNTNASIAKKVMNVMSHKNYLLKPDIDLVDMIAYFFFCFSSYNESMGFDK